MMNETVFLGGVPTTQTDKSPVHFPEFGNNYSIPVGALVGATGGGALGHFIGKKTGTIVGAAIGGALGAAMGWGASGL